MRLGAMYDAWERQRIDPEINQLNFDERFALIVESEYLARENRRLTRRLRDAKLRQSQACVEDVETSKARGLDRATLLQLGTCAWVVHHQNVLLTGATGVGKSFVACALAQAACRKGHRVLYRRLTRLFDELTLARAEGTYIKLLARLAKVDILILDDLGLGQLREEHRHDLLEVFEDRYGTRSTIITSQLPTKKWHQWLGDPTLADGILDRFVHNAYKIDLKGDSRRKPKNQKA
jgi:DNA replication protein DnaC